MNLFKRFIQNKSLGIGVFIIISVNILAIFAPFLAPHHYAEGDLRDAFIPPFTTQKYLLGTDNNGRGYLSRLIYGSRISLMVGIFAQFVNTFIGGAMGISAGWLGGIPDDLIMFWTNVTLSIPVLIFALALMILLGPGLQNLLVAIGITNWCYTCRMARAQTLSIKEEEFVEAAKAVGSSTPRIFRKHIVPNVLSPILVIATLGIGDAILITASLGFLGLGVQPPLPEWGTMLSTGRDFLNIAPWMAIWPGIAIVVTVLGFNLFGDGLRDLMDPHQRG